MSIPTLEALEAANKKYNLYYRQKGSVLYAKRLFRYPGKYAMRAFGRFGFLPNELIVGAKTFWGEDIYVLLRDSNAGSLYYFGFLPRRERRATRFLVKELKPNDIFYDVGANYGFYSLLTLPLVPDGEVHAFEPHPLLFECMKRTFKDRARVVLNEAALSDKKEHVAFFDGYASGHSGGSTLREEVASERPGEWREIEVQAIPLDEYAKTHTPPTVIKLDVEGAEHQVLQGGRETILQHKPVLLLECWGRERWEQYSKNVVELLAQWGYQFCVLDEEGAAHKAVGEKVKESVDRYSYDNIVCLPL